MRIDSPDITPPASGDYRTRVSKGYGDPSGSIILDETTHLELERIRPEDCDRLIRALAEIKTGILAYREKSLLPHGDDHFYQGTCQLCGKPEDDELHAEAAPVIPPAERDCDQVNPDGSGEHCYRGGDHGVHRDSNGTEWRTDLAGTAAGR